MYTEHTTTVSKSMRDGFKAETYFINPNGQAISLNTWKGSRGLHTHYQFGKAKVDDKGRVGSFSFIMFGDKSGRYPEVNARCTEKNIAELHTRSLAQFREEFNAVLAGEELVEEQG